MNKLLSAFAICIQLALTAQNDASSFKKISAHFVWSSVGANTAVIAQFRYKKCEPFVGLMYHINLPVNDLSFHQYRHRFYNKNMIDGIGLSFGVVRPVVIKESDLGLYFLYNGQVSHMHNRYMFAYCDTHSVNYQADRSPDYMYVFSPSQMWIVENNFGFGIDVKMYGGLYLNASVAGGVAAYMVKNQFTNHDFFLDWEFSDQYRIGISYLFSGNRSD